MKYAKFTFLDCDDQQHIITYKLVDSPLTDRWINLVYQNMGNKNHTINSVFSNKTIEDVPELTMIINKLISDINLEYDHMVPIYQFLDREKLNHLHEYYELFGSRPKDNFNYSLIQNFDQLNNLIHNCEHAMFNNSKNFGVFGVIFDIYPRGNYELLLEEHKLMLRSELLWGKIYLGYNTLGKDWLQVIRYNDLDVIKRDSVAVQKQFASELWMNFSRDYEAGWWQGEFYRKVKSYPLDIQEKIPLNNLNDLALGRYLIGEIVIDQEFLKFDSNREHWKINNHKCKSDWNKLIFRKFRQIIDLKII